MPNMTYCRFENTYTDLKDCYEALGEIDMSELSESEREYADKLIKLCSDVHNDFSGIED